MMDRKGFLFASVLAPLMALFGKRAPTEAAAANSAMRRWFDGLSDDELMAMSEYVPTAPDTVYAWRFSSTWNGQEWSETVYYNTKGERVL